MIFAVLIADNNSHDKTPIINNNIRQKHSMEMVKLGGGPSGLGCAGGWAGVG